MKNTTLWRLKAIEQKISFKEKKGILVLFPGQPVPEGTKKQIIQVNFVKARDGRPEGRT